MREVGRPSSLSVLAKYGFEELSATVERLEQLVHLVGDSAHSALAHLASAASPDSGLLAMLRIAESNSGAVKKIFARESSAFRFARVLGASDALADFLARVPENLPLFTQKFDFPTFDSALAAFQTKASPLASNAVDLLRLEYREQLTRIAILDLEQENPTDSFESVSKALSDIAAAVIEHALTIARYELSLDARYGSAPLDGTELAVIAMGKCGARELNYISDVDVIFAYRGDHDLSNEIATKLATRLMRIINAPSSEPPLWEVDPNLRPEGKNGALVRSIESHASYYQKWAENWEFQALLKARPIAGSVSLGQRYVEEVQSQIWSNLKRGSLVDSARQMRGRVLEHIPHDERDRQIKLGRGGLRDVEFTAQLLQLVHGYEDPALRVPDTLSALTALASAGFLGRTDAENFSQAYKVLRTIEHRVQLAQLRRTHLIPKDESARRRIGRSFGAQVDLTHLWEDTRARVATLHDSVFYRPLLNAMANLETGEVRLSDSEVQTRLEALGFVDPVGAIQHITALTSGISRRATIQKTLLPVLLRWLAEGVYPDRGLLSFRRLSEELGDTPWFLRMLRDSAGAAESLMKLLSSSELVATLLEYIPESASWLDDDGNLTPKSKDELRGEFSALIDRNEDISTTAESIRFVRRREVLRLAMGAVLGRLTIEQLSAGMTELTEAYLDGMLALSHISKGIPMQEVELSVVAMGRFGGAEIGFGSDADVILVRSDQSPDREDEIARKALLVAGEWQQLVKDSLVSFELDLDLRPEGKQGPIVRTLGGYKNYYEKWAEVWEYQALLRARPIDSSSRLAQSFLAMVDHYRFPRDLNPKQTVEIRRIKARVETERLPQGADPMRHLKLGRGSISDVEWLAQLLQLKFAHADPNFQTTGTIKALQAANQNGQISSQDFEELQSAWLLASRIRSGLVLANGKQSDILPTDRRQLEAVARILEYPAFEASQLEEDYLAATRKARKVFERIFLAQ